THELQPDGLARDLRHDCRGLSNVILTAVSVIARSFFVTYLDLFSRQSEDASESCACSVNVLSGGNDQSRVRFDVSDRASRAECRMHLIRTTSDLCRDVRSIRDCSGNISFFEHDSILSLLGSHLFVE